MNDKLSRAYDALLIIRFQAGCNDALEELICRYAPSVRLAVVKKVGKRKSVVDDITQEIWIQVIRSLPKLNRPITWQAWLFQIVNRQVALFFRRLEKPIVPIESVVEFVAANNKQVGDKWNIQSHVDSLAEPYRTVIRLRYWSAMSYLAIADALAIPIGTVRSRLSEARKRLTNKLNNQGENND